MNVNVFKEFLKSWPNTCHDYLLKSNNNNIALFVHEET